MAITKAKSTKADAEIAKLVASVVDKNPVDPFSCVMEAELQNLAPSIPQITSSKAESASPSVTQTGLYTRTSSAVAQTPASPTAPIAAENNFCPQYLLDKFNDTERNSDCTDFAAYKAEIVSFKNEILKEIKDAIAAEFAKYNFPQFIKTVVDSTALIQAKCDTVGRVLEPLSNHVVANNPPGQRMLPPHMFEKITTVDSLIALNKKASNPEYVGEYVEKMSIHFGKDTCIKKGRSVAMKLIDQTIDREVFKECCWTGKAKGREKCKFNDLHSFMHMFYCAVRYSDPTFTIEENESFLRSCLSNSGVRAENRFPNIQQSQRKRTSKKAAIGEPNSDYPHQTIRVLSNQEVAVMPGSNVSVLPDGQQIQLIYINNDEAQPTE